MHIGVWFMLWALMCAPPPSQRQLCVHLTLPSLLSSILPVPFSLSLHSKTQVLFRNKVLYPTAVLAQVREIRDCRAQLDEEEMQTKPWVRMYVRLYAVRMYVCVGTVEAYLMWRWWTSYVDVD